MLRDELEKIGLDPKEAAVYLAMLELGETTIARLAKKSKIKRTTVYDVVNSLIEEGLVTITPKNKRKHYAATDPRALEGKIEEKRNVLKAILPELLSITNIIDKKPKITYFEGIGGLKEIYYHHLENYLDRPVWGWLPNDVFPNFGEDFIKRFVAKRIGAKIMSYAIGPNTPAVRELQTHDAQSLRKIKIDPDESHAIEIGIDVYGNNQTSIVSFKEQIGLIIESKLIHNTLRTLFDIHWKTLP